MDGFEINKIVAAILATVLIVFSINKFVDILFYKLIKHTSPLFASSVTYEMPVVALLWGLFDKDLYFVLRLTVYIKQNYFVHVIK